jgi:hypothetical protein
VRRKDAAARAQATISRLYHPVEAAIVRIALNLAPAPGDETLDLWNDRAKLPKGVIYLDSDAFFTHDDETRKLAASEAVAHLILAKVEDQLPQYYSSRRGRRRSDPLPGTFPKA